MDDEYAQPAVQLFRILPVDVICRIIVTLNGGAIDNNAEPERGFLHPGYRGGRELNYFKISRDAMTFWKHVCKYLRRTYSIDDQAHEYLLSDNTPHIEMWEDPHLEEHGSCYWDYYHSHPRFVPRHFYAGDPKPWMERLCYGPQTYDEVLAIEAADQAKTAAKEARKQKRRADAEVALVAWGSGERQLRARK